MSKKPGGRKGELAQRKVNTRDEKDRFLIVCEGIRTEPNYFRKFPVPRDVKEIDIRGVGDNTIRLVEEAKRIRGKEKYKYDQVWCVFDRDSFPLEHFNNAIALAEREGIKVAYSNEAFELWYLLHFDYYDTAIPRADYIKILDKKFDELAGRKYKKNDSDIYALLEKKQVTAIKNAKKLLAEYNPIRPVHDNPSTTVHLLVEELNRFIRP